MVSLVVREDEDEDIMVWFEIVFWMVNVVIIVWVS